MLNRYDRNKKKILNDPVYGFISITDDLIFDLIEHKYLQRLRRIKQLGLTHLVYPGALHTRFHHVIGTMHLMQKTIDILKSKGHAISADETKGALIAILLHDIGHGPYSHTLEKSIVCEPDHEVLSLIFMRKLQESFGDPLALAIEIFSNKYKKKFLHKLVSSQLDMDRLDYLKRDSFYTGVSEGVINTDRIITMLDIANDGPVIEAKGIYSIEKFIIARRLMYWQVYLHKTVLAAEQMLIQIIARAKYLIANGETLFATDPFKLFLAKNVIREDFNSSPQYLEAFAEIDDYDVFTSIKVWVKHKDKVLSTLCNNLVNRHLFRTHIQKIPFQPAYIEEVKSEVMKLYDIDFADTRYFVFTDVAKNSAYDPLNDKINIIFKDGRVEDITRASDQLNVEVLSKTVTKFYLCHPKQIEAVNNSVL
ncbi:MAG: phosphohydrolase [Bacteroidetes bacterium 4484_276]|nr:MAG: phosphohydrolase [Bacteroidetes bacterium 4484_276]OYT13880.1 MAG: phosphohydrolase [Bacteroidetes bacterium 4572_114]